MAILHRSLILVKIIPENFSKFVPGSTGNPDGLKVQKKRMKRLINRSNRPEWFILPALVLIVLIDVVAIYGISHSSVAPDQGGPAAKQMLWMGLIVAFSAMLILLIAGLQRYHYLQIKRPLRKLRNATVSLAEGRYFLDLPARGDAEIVQLIRAFNAMARQVKEKTHELKQERYGRMRSVIDGEEMERQRLSRELHDGIGQLLIAIKLRLESLLYQDETEVKHSIQEMKKYFDEIIDEVRRISNNLLPSVLEAFSIPIAFRNLFSETEEHSNLKIRFEARGNFDDLDKKTKTYIYRLTQEALSNIVKHAEATTVNVKLVRKGESLTLAISDDGKGFLVDQSGKEGGNGIHNMRERASLLRGKIEIASVKGEGTTITLKVPIFIPHVNHQDFPRG